MKVLKPILTFCMLLVFVLPGCENDERDNPANNTADIVKGRIVLPKGSLLDLSTLTVFGPADQSNVNDSKYEVTAPGKYSALYVTNPNDEVVMIGYVYPGNMEGEINATSTALGMIMMAPAVLFLSEQGKQTMVNNIISDNSFKTFRSLIEQNILQNRPLFDTTNTVLMSAMDELFQSASFRISAGNGELPVNMFRSGKNFIFNNSGKSHSTVIGVYKGTTRVEKIVVDGIKVVPGSITDLWAGNGASIGNPVDKSYTLLGDGDFIFKFRTGKPGAGDGSTEHDEAFYENLWGFSHNLLMTLLPHWEPEFGVSSSCYIATKNNAISAYQSIEGLSSNSNLGLGTMLLTVADITLNNINSLLESCTEFKVQQNWFRSFLGQWNFVSSAVGEISNGANTLFFGAQWALSDAVVDTCFNVAGNTVTPGLCGGCKSLNTFTDPRDGQTYQIIKIGTQTWFAENLNYAIGISWCYGNNAEICNTYGRLYEWNTAMIACPKGWHLPSDAEWNVLSSYLGGSLAGGKMKSTTGWNLPNIGATNESCFSGLPGGYRNLDGGGVFVDIGNVGAWWTSTETLNIAAYDRYLYYLFVSPNSHTTPKGYGLSCRCVMD